MIAIIKVLLFADIVFSSLYFLIALTIPDSCYTTPCLSNDVYSLNFLKIDVASSVSAVVYSAILAATPFTGLYLMYMRSQYFMGGLLTGCFMILSLIAWIQAILWYDQHSKIASLSDSELKKFGSKYEKNDGLEFKSIVMSFLCIAIAALNSISFLLLYFSRDEYCVDFNLRPRSAVRSYQAVTTMETND
jgi:hypothetical protein